MDQNQNQNISGLNCALSEDNNWHICKEPIILSCNHYMCKKCVAQASSDTKSLKCKICQTLNERELVESSQSNAMFDNLLNTHLHDIFNRFLKEFENKLCFCDQMLFRSEETIDCKIKFAKEDVEIKIESLKIELDKLQEEFYKKLDKIKQDWTDVWLNNIYKIEIDSKLRGEYEKLKNDIERKQNLTKSSLYEYQEKLQNLDEFIRDLTKYSHNTTVEFLSNESTTQISQNRIGKIKFVDGRGSCVHKEIKKTIKNNEIKYIDLRNGFRPFECCVLPHNNNIVIIDYTNEQLDVYDESFNHIKTVNSINAKRYKFVSLDTNRKDSIFFTCYTNHKIVKTDFEFNQLAIFGETKGCNSTCLNCPYGICYDNGSLYICDYANKRVLKLCEDLSFEASYNLNCNPWYIKIIDNVACIRELSIHFYDLNNFTELKRFDTHNGIIGASEAYFYEYDHLHRQLYCYDVNCELVETIKKGEHPKDSQPNGSICLFGSHIILCNANNTIQII